MSISVIQPSLNLAAVRYDSFLNLNEDQMSQGRGNIQAASKLQALHVNPNILYNWNFSDPIHQEYDTVTDISSGYVIDGWKYSQDGALKASLLSDSLKLDAVNVTDSPAMLIQPIEISKLQKGCSYTISVTYSATTSNVKLVGGYYWPTTQLFIYKSSSALPLLSDGQTEKTAWTMMELPYWESDSIPEGTYFFVGVRLLSSSESVTLKAIKCELGPNSTLNFVYSDNLSPSSPYVKRVWKDTWDYQSELLRCLRYYVRWRGRSSGSNNYIGALVAKSSDKTQMRILVNLPTTTRVKPACTLSGIVADSSSTTEVTLQEIAWGTLASDNYILLLNLPEGNTFADTDLSVRFKDSSAYVIFDARM